MLWLVLVSTPTQVEQVRRAFDRLTGAAATDWQKVLDSLGASDRVLMSKELAQNWVGIVDKYGSMAATFAADYFEGRAGLLGVKPRVKLSPGVNERKATSRLGYALSTANQLGNAATILDELVLQPYRYTLQSSAWASGGAWARVPEGDEPCEFCLMLASRGEVYKTDVSAGAGNDYHGDCRCVPEFVTGPESYPEGYDPTALYERYSNARDAAGYGADGKPLSKTNPKRDGSHADLSNVLSEARRQNGSR